MEVISIFMKVKETICILLSRNQSIEKAEEWKLVFCGQVLAYIGSQQQKFVFFTVLALLHI